MRPVLVRRTRLSGDGPDLGAKRGTRPPSRRAVRPAGPTYRLHLHLWRNLPERRKGRRAFGGKTVPGQFSDPLHSATMQHAGDEPASGRDLWHSCARAAFPAVARSGRLALVASPGRARKRHTPAAAPKCPEPCVAQNSPPDCFLNAPNRSRISGSSCATTGCQTASSPT